MTVLLYILFIISFLVLGLWIALQALRKKLLPKEFLFIVSLAASLLIYYLVFYIYILSPEIAQVVVVLLAVFSFLCLFLIIRGIGLVKDSYKHIRHYYLPPLLIIFGVLVIYGLNFSSCTTNRPILGPYNNIDNRTFCDISWLPIDNGLPFFYGNNILHHQEKERIDTWSLVDRPPLQIAATLPILDLSQHSSILARFYYYDLFSVFLQLSWVGAIWGFLQTLKVNKKLQMLIITGLAATGFFYLNSVFVWPKLLAGSLAFSGIMFFLGKRGRFEFKYLPVAAILLSLGILSHGGVLFTIIPFSLLILLRIIRSKHIDLLPCVIAFLCTITILVSWYAYHDTITKSDRLVKYQLAGVTSAADTRGTLTTIVDQYKKLSLAQVVKIREQNVKTIVTGNFNFSNTCPLRFSSLTNKCFSGQWRTLIFFSTLFGLEAFNMGWLAAAYRLARKRFDSLDKDILLIIAASLIFWVIAMYDPNSTIIHQGSYATMMLIFVFLAKNLADLPVLFLASTTVIQVIIFSFAWIVGYH